ncbi:MAG: DUF2853 family protein [Litorimonas sp.]
MSKLDEKVGKYIDHIKDKLGMEPDVDLLRKVTKAIGPSIYNRDAETVAVKDEGEMKTVKNFALNKLGMDDNEDTHARVQKVADMYAEKARTKNRAVMYYLLVKEFGKEDVYG